MEATQRPPSAQDLSRFLVAHAPCGAGFEVTHGDGRVTIQCRGCGQFHEHVVSDFGNGAQTGVVEVEREIEFQPVPPAPVAPPPTPIEPKSPAEETDEPQRPTKKPKRQKQARGRAKAGKRKGSARSTRERVMIAALLVFALAALAFAVFRVIDARNSSSDTTTPPTSAAAAPAESAAKPEKQEPAGDNTGQTPAPAAGQRRQVEGASMVLPPEWTQTGYNGGTLVGPPGTSPVSIQVFAESTSSKDLATAAEQAVGFAQSQIGGGQVGSAKTRTISGARAYEVTITGSSSAREVLVMLAHGKRYLVVGSVSDKAGADQKADVATALRTFRP